MQTKKLLLIFIILLISLVTISSNAKPSLAGTYTYEPNDSSSSAATISSNAYFNAAIYPFSYDVDWYKFTSNITGRKIIRLYVPSSNDFDLDVFDANTGTLLASSRSGLGYSEMVSIPVVYGQIYYIRVYKGYNASSSGSRYYDLQIVDDPHEINDSISQARTLQSGLGYYINSATDVDFVKYTPTTNSKVSIVLKPSGTYEMQMFDASGNPIQTASSGQGTDKIIQMNVTAYTTYYFKIYGINGSFNLSSPYYIYTYTDSYETNDLIPQSYNWNLNTINSQISSSSDVDFYKFTTSSSLSSPRLMITLNPNNTNNYDMQLVDSSGNVIVTSNPLDAYKKTITLDVTPSTTYYLKIQSANGSYSYSQNYTLSAAFDDWEINDSQSQASTLDINGAPYFLKISSPSDLDYFKITANNDGKLIVKLTVPSTRDYQLQVANSAGDILGTSINGAGATEYVVLNVTNGSSYYIKVYGQNGNYDTQSYATITCLWDDFEYNDNIASAYSITDTTLYSSYISNNTDVDYYKISYNGLQNKAAVFLDNALNLRFEQVDVNGNTIQTAQTGTAQYISLNVEPNTAYYIRVSGVNGYSNPDSPYTISWVQDNYEDNDTQAQAIQVDNYTDYASYLTSVNDIDYYKFNAPYTGSMAALLTVPTGKNYDIQVINASETTLVSGNNLNGEENVSFNVLQGDVYYLKIFGVSGALSKDPYVFKISRPPTSENYSLSSPHPYPNYYNNTWTISKNGASKIRVHFSSISTETNYDYVKTSSGNSWSGYYSNIWSNWSSGNSINVSLTSDNIITDYGFDIDRIEYQLDPLIISQNPTVTELTDDSVQINWVTNNVSNSQVNYGTSPDSLNTTTSIASSVTNHSVTLTGLTPGTRYYYKVLSSDVSSTIESGVYPFIKDNHEPNNSISGPPSISQGTINSFISTSIDDDFYKLVTPISGQINITLSGQVGANYDLKLLDLYGNIIAESTTSGSNETITQNLNAMSTYYVKVYRTDGGYGEIPYTLKISYPYNYVYDDSNRLDYIEFLSGVKVDFTYDNNGNLISKTRVNQ